jgi:hypothetical protein
MKTDNLTSAVLAMVFFFCFVTAAAEPNGSAEPPNLLSNGSFEDGNYSAAGNPTGWAKDAWLPTSILSWDDNRARTDHKSVKIYAPTANDARWIQTVDVEPNTWYLLSGWIKTDNVRHTSQSVDAGANLSRFGTWERSAGVFGSQGWTRNTLLFNSGDDTEVTVGARLGYWSGTTTGTAWFDDLKLQPIVSAQTATEIAKLLAGDGAANDQFGFSVAVSGDTAVVGAVVDDPGGSAYVFTRTGATWTEQAKLTASDAVDADEFGRSVAVSGDTAVIGASEDDDAGSRSGSVYVFTRAGTTWTQQAKLTASDAAAGDHFGISVAVTGDTAVVGAIGDGDAGISSGSAYVFTRTGTTWTEQVKLTASDAVAGDEFGNSVALSGNTAVVGATMPGSDEIGPSGNGSAYVFTRTGTTWTEQAKLTASDAAVRDHFGRSVAVTGNTAVVGADLDDDAGISSGSAYVFTRTGTTWTEQAKLTASDAAAEDRFGNSVALTGNTAVIGAYRGGDAGIRGGSAYVFTRIGTTWTQQSKLTAGDAARDDYFGFSVALSGNTAVIGSRGDDEAGFSGGSAYVFSLGAEVEIDIRPFGKPGKPNKIKLPPPLQRVRVLILSTNTASGESVDFDALQVDPTTVQFGPNGATSIPRYVQVVDKDRDGDKDLLLRFNTFWTGIRCGHTEATMTGKTYAGESFTGSDSVSPYPCP